MLKTSGEMESTGGEPEPINIVLQETHEELIYGLISIKSNGSNQTHQLRNLVLL